MEGVLRQVNRNAFRERLVRFRKNLEEHDLDGFLVAVPENRYYLSGYEAEDAQLTESSGYLLITSSHQVLLTDFRYKEEGEREAPDFELHIYSDGLAQLLKDLFLALPVEKLGVEGHFLTFNTFNEVEKALRESRPSARLVATEGLVEQLRIVKEPEEIEKIRKSLELTERALVAVWDKLAVGRKEKEIAWAIESAIREGGGEAVSFPPIVASGPNASLPHAVPTERAIKSGEPVILDLGSKLRHYCSDMTRTWIAGEADTRLRDIYSIVREAQLAAQDAIKAGKETTEIDAVARDFIARAGYGECFGHGLGHGVGLAVHEKPGLRKLKATVLEKDMIVTVEPGIYLSGYGGVRLENMVRVTSTGCEVLNREDLFYYW
jgi:Xaa-Pro aminopeptidase